MKILFFLKPKNDLAFLESDYTLRNAMEKIEHYRFSELPIVEANTGKYICTLSEGDILWYIKSLGNFDLKKSEEIKIMDIPIYHHYKTIKVDSEIQDLLPLAKSQNFVPVVDDRNVFIGIIRRQDIIDFFYKKAKDNLDD